MYTFARIYTLCLLLVYPVACAKVIGVNIAPAPLSIERIAAMPPASQAVWRNYSERSARAKASDQASLKAELLALKRSEAAPPPKGHNAGLPLGKSLTWYSSAEGLRVAHCIVSFQTPSGGWGKNIDMAKAPREPGQHFATENSNAFPSPNDNDVHPSDRWSYVGTFDNDATITQLRFLSKTVSALEKGKREEYEAAFIRGLNYVLAAQYPNGGYPQVYPLMGGYHDAITLNDGAMVGILAFLQEVSDGVGSFEWVPSALREQAAAAEARGIDCLLACQIRDGGQLTVWCQQHDLFTLQPAPARNYEMPSECAAESAQIVRFLMGLKPRRQAVSDSVHAAIAWFSKTALQDVAVESKNGDRTLVPSPGSGPLWARCYEMGTQRPIFGDRDKSIHDDLNEISVERRKGYSWYGPYGSSVLAQYAKWHVGD